MDYDTPTHGDTSATPDTPRVRTARKPALHLDLNTGPQIATEARIHLETLSVEEKAAFGSSKRLIANRRWLWEMFLGQLEEFHGIEDGA
jgi:hypothetical protein